MARAAAANPSSCNSLEQPERARCFFIVFPSPRGRLEEVFVDSNLLLKRPYVLAERFFAVVLAERHRKL